MEYLKGKASIKCGKSCGEDRVMPEPITKSGDLTKARQL
jgi:hypothetical protein